MKASKKLFDVMLMFRTLVSDQAVTDVSTSVPAYSFASRVKAAVLKSLMALAHLNAQPPDPLSVHIPRSLRNAVCVHTTLPLALGELPVLQHGVETLPAAWVCSLTTHRNLVLFALIPR